MPLDLPAFQLLTCLPKLPLGKLLKPDRESVTASKKAFRETGALPRFTYKKAQMFDAGSYRTKLDEAKKELEKLVLNETVKQLYRDKFAELENRLKLIEAVQAGDDRSVAELSQILFDKPKSTSTELQREFDTQCARAEKGHLHLHAPEIHAELFSSMVRATLDHYGMTNWRIKLAPRSTVHIGHGKRDRSPLIKIPKKLHITKRRAKRLLTHEIEVHALRTANGESSPLLLLGRGLAGYLKTEEGLAMWYQSKVTRRSLEHVPGFWEAWAAALFVEKGFVEAYSTICDARTKLAVLMGDAQAEAKGKKAAWNLCLRFSKGISRPGPAGVGYFRDHIYRDGFVEVDSFTKINNKEILGALFWGNLGIKNIDLIRSLNLPKPRTPELIASKITHKILLSQ